MQDEQSVREAIEVLERRKKSLENMSAYGGKRHEANIVLSEELQPSQEIMSTLDDDLDELKRYADYMRQSNPSGDEGLMAKAVWNWTVDSTVGAALLLVAPQLLGSEENAQMYDAIMNKFRINDFETQHDREMAKYTGYALDLMVAFFPFAITDSIKAPISFTKLSRTPTQALKGVSTLSTLTDSQLVANAEALFTATASVRLESLGVSVTRESVRSLRRITVAVLQGTNDGRVVTLAAINNADFYLDLQQVVAGGGIELVMGDALVPIGKRGYPLLRLEWGHAEQALVDEAVRLGLKDIRIASSNPGCWNCQWTAIEQGVRHVNPAPIDTIRSW
jgi:hypothetical protein